MVNLSNTVYLKWGYWNAFGLDFVHLVVCVKDSGLASVSNNYQR